MSHSGWKGKKKKASTLSIKGTQPYQKLKVIYNTALRLVIPGKKNLWLLNKQFYGKYTTCLTESQKESQKLIRENLLNQKSKIYSNPRR